MISYGMHLSASGALTSMYRQDVITHNLANAQTPGFKPDTALAVARDPARVEDGLWHLASNELMERLGGGTHLLPNMVSHAQGVLEQTGEPLDLAIRGDGFFVVRDAADVSGIAVRLTRDGRMTRRDDGTLVTAAGGLPVLDVQGRAIVVPADARPEIGSDGTITDRGMPLARIQLADVPDRAQLTRREGGLFEPSDRALEEMRPASGRVMPGFIEGAAVDEIAAMMAVASASRAVQTNLAMISYHDRAMEQAVRTLGRVA